MNSSRISNCRLLLAICLVIVLGAGPVRAQNVSPELEQRIGQTLLNTIKGTSLDYPPTPERIAEFRAEGETEAGTGYGVTDEVRSSVDDKLIRVSLNIAVLPAGYQPDPDRAAQWQSIRAGVHKPTGAEIAFRESMQGEVRRHRVYYRLDDGQVRLLMHVTRTGDESAKEAINKTSDQFTMFYNFAGDQGLVKKKDAEPAIAVEYERTAGKPEVVANQDVIEAPYERAATVDLHFLVSAITEMITEDEPLRIDVRLDRQTGTAGTQLLDMYEQRLPDGNSDGWQELTSEDNRPARLIVRLNELQPTDEDPWGIEQFAVVYLRVQKNQDGEMLTFSFGIQRRNWAVIVQRFEIMAADLQHTGQEFESRRGQRIDLDGRLGFNSYVGEGGKLLQNYQRLLEMVQTPRGSFDTDDPVCMSWQRDFSSQKSYDFITASDAPGEKPLPVLSVHRRASVIVDLKIVQAPKRRLREATDEFGDGILGDEEFDVLEEEKAIREKIVFHDLEIVRTPLAPAANGESGDDFRRQLSSRLRVAPGNDAGSRPVYGLSGKRMLDEHFPLTNRYDNPDARPEERVAAGMARASAILIEPHRTAGTYELRLKANLGLDRHDEPRSVDVAIRYGVSPLETDFTLLEWTQTRGQ